MSYFSSLHQPISDYFNSEDPVNNSGIYCAARIAYQWNKGKMVDSGADKYHERIKAFLSKVPKGLVSTDVLVIIGGIGNGKTTAIKYVLEQTPLCTGGCMQPSPCQHPLPGPIKFDFTSIGYTPESDTQTVPRHEVNFWNYVEHTFKELTAQSDESIDDLLEYWEWLQAHPRATYIASGLATHIEGCIHRLKAARARKISGSLEPDAYLALLHRAYEDWIHVAPADERCFYRILRYTYLHRSGIECRCCVFVLDNIDHLHPRVQPLALTLATQLIRLIPSKAVITLRPLTWERYAHAHQLLPQEAHFAPDVNEVINRRLQGFLLANSQLERRMRKALRAVTGIITGGSKRFPTSGLVKTTSGHSARFAIRNYLNMLESPIWTEDVVTRVLDEEEHVRVSDIAKAYFFGPTETIIVHAHENLYEVGGSMSLVKPRALDYIIREKKGSVRLLELLGFMEWFGNEREEVIQGLNELLTSTRPLIWSNTGYHIDGAHESDSRLVVTPIGRSYMDDLFGELFYDEACLAKNLHDYPTLAQVLAHHKDLTDLDVEEVRVFVHVNHVPDFYSKFYKPPLVSLSMRHYDRLKVGLEGRKTEYLDEGREHWLRDQFNDILSSAHR